MTLTLTARPTTYNGVKMRSRLEARVAAWLDSAGLDWQYEPHAFASSAGQYLPDFRLQVKVPFRYGGAKTTALYVEVKPRYSREVADAAEARMMVIRASEPDAALAVLYADILENSGSFMVLLDDENHRYGAIITCPDCSWSTIGFALEARRYINDPTRPSRFLFFCPLCEMETMVEDGDRIQLPEWDA